MILTNFTSSIQYRLTMKYLSEMTDNQTLVLYSGHPLGLFPSHTDAPRLVVTNGMVIPNYSSRDHLEKFNALDIYDGSKFTADMAVQNVIGDSFRGATWVSLHNGGGVGWGEVINGGFGMLLDGTAATGNKVRMMLHWDVNNGIARRSWARNKGAMFTLKREMDRTPGLIVTVPYIADDEMIDEALLF